MGHKIGRQKQAYSIANFGKTVKKAECSEVSYLGKLEGQKECCRENMAAPL
jgi:hypothetical protein